jgi:hypothetical protein
MLTFGGANMLIKTPMVTEGLVKFGYPPSALALIGTAALSSAILFAIPRTALLGAILLTAYFGGAVNTHVRAGEPFWFAIVFGVLVWAGLWCREPRLRALLPLIKP